MYREQQSLKFDTHAFSSQASDKSVLQKFKPLIWAGIFLGAWIYAMSLYGG